VEPSYGTSDVLLNCGSNFNRNDNHKKETPKGAENSRLLFNYNLFKKSQEVNFGFSALTLTSILSESRLRRLKECLA